MIYLEPDVFDPEHPDLAEGWSDGYQSMIAAPQVKPEPKATVAIFMPRSSRPSPCASASMMGMVAAVVLP